MSAEEEASKKLMKLAIEFNSQVVEQASHMVLAQNMGNRKQAAMFRGEAHLVLDVFLNNILEVTKCK